MRLPFIQERAEKVAAQDAALAAKGLDATIFGERRVQPALQEDNIKGWGNVAVADAGSCGWGEEESGAVKPETGSSKALGVSQSAHENEGIDPLKF
jgi:hypothetical protein